MRGGSERMTNSQSLRSRAAKSRARRKDFVFEKDIIFMEKKYNILLIKNNIYTKLFVNKVFIKPIVNFKEIILFNMPEKTPETPMRNDTRMINYFCINDKPEIEEIVTFLFNEPLDFRDRKKRIIKNKGKFNGKKLDNYIDFNFINEKITHFKKYTLVKATQSSDGPSVPEVTDEDIFGYINENILSEYNEKLQEKCDFFLKLDLYYNFIIKYDSISIFSPDAIQIQIPMLSLIYKDHIISSISYKINPDNIIEISSSTDKKYENNRYNKLLRCISVIIFNEINKKYNTEYHIYSNAINKISGWLLLQTYETVVDLKIPELLEKIKEYTDTEPSREEVLEVDKIDYKTDGLEIIYEDLKKDLKSSLYKISSLNINVDTIYQKYCKRTSKPSPINIIYDKIFELFENIHITIIPDETNKEKAKDIFNELIAEGSKKKLSCPEDKCNNIYDELQKCLSNIPVNPDDSNCKTLKTLLKGKTNKNIHCNLELEIDSTLEKPTPIKILKSFETSDNEINIIDYLNTYYRDLLTEDGSEENNAPSRERTRRRKSVKGARARPSASSSSNSGSSPGARSPRARSPRARSASASSDGNNRSNSIRDMDTRGIKIITNSEGKARSAGSTEA